MPIAVRGFSILPVRALGARLLICCLLLVAGALVAAAETSDAVPAPGKRVALVIGNGAYGDLGTLPNPPRDAADVSDALKALNFEVFTVVDGTKGAVDDALRRFGRAAGDADVALFYFAGHGLAVAGENYLVPVQAQISDQADLRFETLNLSDVRDQLDYTNAKFKIVILDACRNNPLARTLRVSSAQRSVAADSGLAPVGISEVQASGMLIVYATAANQVALDGNNQRNSPFTTALLANIATPQTEVRTMFTRVRSAVVASTDGHQVPWTEDGMLGEFEFNPVAPEPEKPPADLTAWRDISASGDPADFEKFIDTYPDSFAVSIARGQLALLKDPGKEAEAWKALTGSTDTGAYEVFLRRYPEGVYAPVASFALQNLLWQQLASQGDTAGMEAFLQRFPSSPFAGLVRGTLADLKAKAAAAEARAAAEAKAAAEAQAVASQVVPTAPQIQTAALSQAPSPAVAAPSPAVAAPAPQAAPAAPVPTAATAPASALPVAPATPSPAPAAAPEAQRLLVLARPPDSAPSDAEQAALARASEIPPHLIQFALSALGYYDGRADGRFGPASRKAVIRYQQHLGAAPTGDLQPQQIVALVAEAANSGNADSQTIYGLMFANGEGVVQDYARAAKWFGLAADAGNGYGQMNLGLLYRDGLGVPKDPAKARNLLERAAANGQEAARKALESLN